ncbi:MAG: SMC-Scp complex subunit ScpB [Deltaproteobacteria bacterium]|nr:SMC-Scp complex subunit ScpB [Deltaproteobacteria bacterium]
MWGLVNSADQSKIEREFEAVLLSAGSKGLKLNKIQEVFPITFEDVVSIIRKLNLANRSYEIILIGDKVYAQIREEYSDLLKKAGLLNRNNLSRANLETLSIIAYLAPCPKSYIDFIRGVDCSQSLNVLIESGYVEVIDTPSGSCYSLSDKTLSMLKISSARDLDDYEEIRGEFLSKIQNI